jgi:hypothetical protein
MTLLPGVNDQMELEIADSMKGGLFLQPCEEGFPEGGLVCRIHSSF